jgi:hypothetical protein
MVGNATGSKNERREAMNTAPQETLEKAWVDEYERYLSAREMGKARRKAIGRLLLGSRGGRAAVSDRKVPIESIVGMMNGDGRTVRRLPPLSRKLVAAWQQGLALEESDTRFLLGVRSGPDGWYLTGGVSALLHLEILRAKGRRFIEVAPDDPAPLSVCRCANRGFDCCEELPGIAG